MRTQGQMNRDTQAPTYYIFLFLSLYIRIVWMDAQLLNHVQIFVTPWAV